MRPPLAGDLDTVTYCNVNIHVQSLVVEFTTDKNRTHYAGIIPWCNHRRAGQARPQSKYAREGSTRYRSGWLEDGKRVGHYHFIVELDLHPINTSIVKYVVDKANDY
jgi:hypothetical protein